MRACVRVRACVRGVGAWWREKMVPRGLWWGEMKMESRGLWRGEMKMESRGLWWGVLSGVGGQDGTVMSIVSDARKSKPTMRCAPSWKRREGVGVRVRGEAKGAATTLSCFGLFGAVLAGVRAGRGRQRGGRRSRSGVRWRGRQRRG